MISDPANDSSSVACKENNTSKHGNDNKRQKLNVSLGGFATAAAMMRCKSSWTKEDSKKLETMKEEEEPNKNKENNTDQQRLQQRAGSRR